MMLPNPLPPRPTLCVDCGSRTKAVDDKWECPYCGLVGRDLSEDELATQRTYDIFERQRADRHRKIATKDETILLGQLVHGHLLQAGIALAVAQGVWHWAEGGSWKERKIWTVSDVIEVLRNSDRILIFDQSVMLSLQGETRRVGNRIWVKRGDYVQAVLLLAAQAVDVMRQIRE